MLKTPPKPHKAEGAKPEKKKAAKAKNAS